MIFFLLRNATKESKKKIIRFQNRNKKSQFHALSSRQSTEKKGCNERLIKEDAKLKRLIDLFTVKSATATKTNGRKHQLLTGYSYFRHRNKTTALNIH